MCKNRKTYITHICRTARNNFRSSSCTGEGDNLLGVPCRKGWTGGAAGSQVKMLLRHWHSPSLTPLARLSTQTVPCCLSGCPSISWKNSLIKVQTVAGFPLLKGLKSFLCYVANYALSLTDKYLIHKTFSLLWLLVASPPLTLTNRSYPTDTWTDKWGQVLPTFVHCAIFCLARLF